jgi:hypothetical protein
MADLLTTEGILELCDEISWRCKRANEHGERECHDRMLGEAADALHMPGSPDWDAVLTKARLALHWASIGGNEQAYQDLRAALGSEDTTWGELIGEVARIKREWSTSAAAGHEAEDLRRELNRLCERDEITPEDLQGVMDSVDARDSLAFLMSKDQG